MFVSLVWSAAAAIMIHVQANVLERDRPTDRPIKSNRTAASSFKFKNLKASRPACARAFFVTKSF